MDGFVAGTVERQAPVGRPLLLDLFVAMEPAQDLVEGDQSEVPLVHCDDFDMQERQDCPRQKEPTQVMQNPTIQRHADGVEEAVGSESVHLELSQKGAMI